MSETVIHAGYWYHIVEILEVLHVILKNHRYPWKYIQLNVSFDNIETIKMFVVNMNLIYNAITQKNDVAVICHVGYNHYTALFFDSTYKQALYNDSMGTSIPYQLEDCIQQMKFKVIDFKLRQQEDALSCGAFALYNLACFSKALKPRFPDSNVLRQDHYKILNGGEITFNHTEDDHYLKKHENF